MMETPQAGQKEKLMEFSLEMAHQPRGSPADRHGRFKCIVALVTVIGLVLVALVAGFILHYFMFTPSCNQAVSVQDVPPLSDAAKVNITCKLKKSDEQGRYDIFTVHKTGTYLIYGWVKLSNDSSDCQDIVLKQVMERMEGFIQMKNGKIEKEIFFFSRVLLSRNFKISIYFRCDYTDSLFHLYEL